MAQGEFDQVVIGHADLVIQLKLKHIILLDLDRIFNRHDLLVRKALLRQSMHESGLSRANGARKKIKPTTSQFLLQVWQLVKPKPQFTFLIMQEPNDQAFITTIIPHR